MPTSFMSGESCAPMENSPPGIQTIPSGALSGGKLSFSMLGAKEAFEAEALMLGDGVARCISEVRLMPNQKSIGAISASTAPIVQTR